MLQLSDILKLSGHDLTQIAVLLHKPREKALCSMLPLFALERPELFDAYQATHGTTAQATLKKRNLVASFVATTDGSLIFAGLFQKSGARMRPRSEIGQDPAIRELIEVFKACIEFANEPDGDHLWFDLIRTDLLADYVGRLRIAPPMTQTYARIAENLHTEVIAIERENALASAAPDWQDFIVTGPEMRLLPPSWRARLREWCGIYLIIDQFDGKRYVGAAYGDEGFLGRWGAHVKGKQGVTAELAKRDPAQFCFSILELLAKNPTESYVFARESNWKKRLAARDANIGGMNRN